MTLYGKVTKTQENISYKRAKRSALFRDHKAARNIPDSMKDMNIHHIKDPQKKHPVETVNNFFYNFIFPSQHASHITFINIYNSLNHGLYLHTVFEFLVI